jgi:REP-associated tyrosine transposase
MHTFTNSLFHCLWSTKGRQPVLTREVLARLWPYLGGIARANKISALAIGGVADHVHVLISLPPSISLSKAVQLLKGNSSKWLHEEFRELRSFNWQEGYGAFSIGISGLEETKKYIASQAEHHLKKTFLEEFKAFLEKHGHAYDERGIYE